MEEEVYYLTKSVQNSSFVFPEEIDGIEQLDLSATSTLAFPIERTHSRFVYPERLRIKYSNDEKTGVAVLNRIERHTYWTELEGYTFLFSAKYLGHYGGEKKPQTELAELFFENTTTFFNALAEKHLFFVGSTSIID